MIKTRPNSIVTTTCFAICGWFFVQPQAVNAFGVTYNQYSGGAYRYTVTLDSSGESLAQGDFLRFSDLFGVTNASADSPYVLDFSNSDEVDLRVQSNTSGPRTFNVAIFSPAAPGTVTYTASYQVSDPDPEFGSIAVSPIGTITGPAAAQAVPFEFSPSTGLLSLAVLFWFKRGWKFLMSKEKPAI